MKNSLHSAICTVWISVALTACEKKQDSYGSNNTAPSNADTSSDCDAAAMADPDDSRTATGDPSDIYFQAYLLTRSAGETTNREQSIRKLQKALDLFRAVKKQHPEWKLEMVNARIQRTEESLADLSMF